MKNDPAIAPEDQVEFQQSQTREHIRPPAVFKGKDLNPYSPGTKLLYWQVINDNDTRTYRLLAFIYILMHPRADMVKLAWNQDVFREAIMGFMDDLTQADVEEAGRIADEILAAERSTSVVPVDNNAGGKKNET